MSKTITHDGSLAKFGSQDHLQVSQDKSFTELVFELLSGQSPSKLERELFDLILNLSIDHGPDTPSATEVINSAKQGKNISSSVASGILQISDTHGGAVEPAMDLFYEIMRKGLSIPKLVEEYLNTGRRISGFGHRIYEIDPRAQLILSKLDSHNLGEEFIKIGLDIESELFKQKGKRLPLNIDGAIGIALCSFGWESNLGKATFIIARTPGLCGQFLNNS
ncbi:MAG: hypothetical protein A3F33_03580 [Candidatus Woykebacteria bacterium RIFCSPHIGHO2_12_FULL_43_10]|uniref:citrate synthase (unknown stereospecificity) n=2 Tax=Candidatus Woykeibacteriota TaxID=1817899 RepID=A0A1G1WX68_9BACT|nr:MAG: hypothetical protein A3J50_03290 [Candidatus Woykebacteria bacterium RIFCSPHIGHO2_02_FULL_43_16b]OGY30215.1 MAG: hypothetical protein A3F33_03580 [Candidatus Woykebacteria bacterium RIFCSPHIGHO2_12_FULL_43_10]OGY31757.1 MAG: hypothetical protein A3A61_02020 [Candidatus Woykebacteria bacterium RIFCSPLOWO2_01_FULL_43_14]